MTRFDDATTVRRTDEGHYAADLDSGYLIGSALNGGYLMAVLQRAVLAESDHLHAVSSSYTFLRPAGPGRALVHAEVLKPGRTVTTVRIGLEQDGKAIVTGTVATATLDRQAVPDYESVPAEVAPIGRCRSFDPRADPSAAMEFADRIDLRFAPDSYAALAGQEPATGPDLRGHLDLSAVDGGPVADPLTFLPLAVDALPPVVSVLSSWSWAPTVQLSWQLRALPEPGPLAFHARADLVADGWFDENVDLWDVKGRLVAQSRQLARIGR
ncbi:thioesterase family protein [Nocardiopsis ansamitocini]|uniref:Acyl-CoA thioesterase n=1 Tax=Nocardiopsis ansamitocini TaxID=1670832 RepID=A0A9W6PA39_9ACTN|nr:thioesterase family protein [Nocardiopsis ansamitocini]GLU50455.1 hypothetical protein Nans01_48060 [Nocardiopsis ansamitocini]